MANSMAIPYIRGFAVEKDPMIPTRSVVKLYVDLETVGDTPWRSAWEKSFGEQQLFNQMVFFSKEEFENMYSLDSF